MIYYFAYLLVISVAYYITGICADTSIKEPINNAFQLLKHDNLLEDIIDKTLLPQAEICNASNPCQNAGTCFEGECRCSKDYTGDWCETPTWCTRGKCGYGDDVECVWDRSLRKGECRCKKDKYYYLSKDRKCHECECGDHGQCLVVDQMLVCECEENYALKSSKCEYCDCGPRSEKCSFDYRGNTICQCQKNYASKTARWSSYNSWCEICDCEHGKCRWEGDEKLCDCEAGFRSFGAKCKDCNCGPHGTCELNELGEKICTCDYGSAEDDGICRDCDCNQVSRRYTGIDCKFDNGIKQCICPPGFELKFDNYCQDINECIRNNPCPADTNCINRPGTFECRCKEGFEPVDSTLGAKLSGCRDINECLDFPCESSTTECVNSLGSYDCACKDGYYSTTGNYGYTYKPTYNTCNEIKTQWREATIALGVIFSVGIIGMAHYIKKHKRRS